MHSMYKQHNLRPDRADAQTSLSLCYLLLHHVSFYLYVDIIFTDLYGKNNLESAFIDQIMDTILDLNNAGMNEGKPYHRGEDEAKKVKFTELSN